MPETEPRVGKTWGPDGVCLATGPRGHRQAKNSSNPKLGREEEDWAGGGSREAPGPFGQRANCSRELQATMWLVSVSCVPGKGRTSEAGNVVSEPRTPGALSPRRLPRVAGPALGAQPREHLASFPEPLTSKTTLGRAL
jgi:hypothetical protein